MQKSKDSPRTVAECDAEIQRLQQIRKELDDNNWYVRERRDGFETWWKPVHFKCGPRVFDDIRKGPCTSVEAENAANAHNEKQRAKQQARFEEYLRRDKASHEERMRTDPTYRAEREKRDEEWARRFKAFQEQQRIAAERWRQQEEAQKAANYMAHDVVDAGRKAMAKKLHPDAGGDHDDMLERTCELLRQNLSSRSRRYARRSKQRP